MRPDALVPYTRHAHVLCLFILRHLNDMFQCNSASAVRIQSIRLYIPSSQPPQYVPPSSKSNRPPFICGLVDDAFAAAEFAAIVVDADPGEFGAIAAM